ncbi:MAG: alpha/beta hydrolase [Acidobacteria bacterium]|nr:alpha/beta hydrolase [Acidobacteriota bacterium]
MQFPIPRVPVVWTLLLFLVHPLSLRAEFVEVAPQVKIYYESFGQGDALLFVPGWMMTAGIWKEQAAAFSKTHRVIVMDPRGQGNSSKVLSGNTLQQQAKDLRRLMESLQLDGVTVVAWSMAVAVVLEYVNQLGNGRLKSAVLVDGWPSMVKKDDWPRGLTPEETNRLVLDWENNRMAKTNEFIDSMFTTERSDPELEWMVKEALRTPTTVATILGYDYFSSDRRPLLSKIAVPTLITMTTENKEIGEFMKSQIPNSQLTVFEGLGHAMFLDDPKKFNERLTAFLQSTE